MEILGMKLVPLNEPLISRLQMVVATLTFVLFTVTGYICLAICIRLLFTSYWYFVLPYFLWIYVDRETCEKGGRIYRWIENWTFWYHLKNYFPATLVLDPDLKLDPKKNYLFCTFPHGVIPAGPFTNLSSAWSEFRKLYPNFQVKLTFLKQMFFLPVTRELTFAVGGVSPSVQSLTYLLKKPQGGSVVVLWPGGAAEAANTFPGTYKIVLKKRKGFVKMALRCGSPLVPVITFGENDMYGQIRGPIIGKIQDFIKTNIGFTPILFVGRGFFQYSFGIAPRKTPLTTVVGKSIEVIKTENPTTEQIEELHKKFVEELENLFEKYKYKYVENPENTVLEIT